jgi:hypothetical protein
MGVAVGVDSHKSSFAVAVLDEIGRPIGAREFNKGNRKMARETRYRVIYFDENNKEVYNEDFHTFHDMLVEGQPLTPPPHVKRTEVWMTHLLFSTPES